MRTGALTVVGSGIRLASQMTMETRLAIEAADKVLYGVDEATARWLRQLNPTAESLDRPVPANRRRQEVYRQTVERMMAEVRRGRQVCVVYYGHPGVFVYATHEAIRQCRQEGIPARMLAGISAEDCLFADLGVDPGMQGCQGFEATDFLMRRRIFDPNSALILWQVAFIGVLDYSRMPDGLGLRVLVEYLLPFYGAGHRVILYRGSQFPVSRSELVSVPLERLAQAPVTAYSTLYVPPRGRTEPDLAMAERLSLPREMFRRESTGAGAASL